MSTVYQIVLSFVLAHREVFTPAAGALAAAVVGLVLSPLRGSTSARWRALYGIVAQLVPDVANRPKLTNDFQTLFSGVPLNYASATSTVTIALVTETTRLSFADLQKIATACKKQLASHVAPAWGRAAWNVVAVASRGAAPKGAIVIVGVGYDASVPDALGWHSEDSNGRIVGEIAIGTTLDAGGQVLTGAYSVASVFSHEIIETFLDASVSTWDVAADGSLYAHEGCDAVEGDGYMIGPVMVSNFVLPPFFDPQAAKGSRYDYLGKLTAAFQTAPGGYQVVMSAGMDNGVPALITTQVFGAKVPAHIRSSRAKARRVVGRCLARKPR